MFEGLGRGGGVALLLVFGASGLKHQTVLSRVIFSTGCWFSAHLCFFCPVEVL